MLSQENIYALILKENWTEILNVLYEHRNDIANDQLLKQAGSVFEGEFFEKIKKYPIERNDILESLDILYVLNFGKFYRLSPENYKNLIVEMVKRKSPSDAIPFAREFPDEEVCKAIIGKIVRQDLVKDNNYNSKTILMNWIEVYNRLFELINNQGDSATYFSGPRFISTVKEFEPYFPDYNQYINKRNQEGKSTSRKIYYYDILSELKEETRVRVINRILEILKPFLKQKVELIEELLGNKKSQKVVEVRETNKSVKSNPKVFISYSWDDESHKQWVLNMANRLCSDGIDVIIDRYYLQPGKSLPHFVEESISKADRIVIIFTPNYKLKADKRAGGVGYEYSIMNVELYNNQTTNDKIIPVLRNGGALESIPAFMQQFIHIDIRNDENFENSYTDLVREIYNEPEIQKPQIGEKPSFKGMATKEIEKNLVTAKTNFKSEITGEVHPGVLSRLKMNDTPLLTLKDGRVINAGTIRIEDFHLIHYTGKGLREIWKPTMNEEEKKKSRELKEKTEEFLTENGYIAWTPLDQILDLNR